MIVKLYFTCRLMTIQRAVFGCTGAAALRAGQCTGLETVPRRFAREHARGLDRSRGTSRRAMLGGWMGGAAFRTGKCSYVFCVPSLPPQAPPKQKGPPKGPPRDLKSVVSATASHVFTTFSKYSSEILKMFTKYS